MLSNPLAVLSIKQDGGNSVIALHIYCSVVVGIGPGCVVAWSAI